MLYVIKKKIKNSHAAMQNYTISYYLKLTQSICTFCIIKKYVFSLQDK